MTLPVSPSSISLAQVNFELGRSTTATISLNDSIVRTLFNKASGVISFRDGYGKGATAPPTSVLNTPSFTVATGGVAQVSFTWNTVPNATSYDVTFNGITTNQAGTTFTRTGLAVGTYSLSVVAKAFGYSNSSAGTSNPVTVTNPATPTLNTPVFTAASGGVNQVSFTWGAVTNATSYDVTFNSVITNQTGTTFSQSSVAAGAYNLSVVAKAAGYNNSSAGVSTSVTVTATSAVPAAPSYVISNKTTTSYTITLRASTATYYYLYETTGGLFAVVGSNPTGIFEISGKSPSSTQSYICLSSNAVGVGAITIFDVQTSAATAVGFTPVSYSQYIDAANYITYKLDAVVTRVCTITATGLDVQLSVDSGVTFQDIDNATGNGETKILSTTAGQSYIIVVRPYPTRSGTCTLTIT